MTRSKVGWHTSGSGGNPTGIGTAIRSLDAAGIPVCIVCADGDVGLADALATGSNVPHALAFRVVRDGSEAFAVPDYSKSPKEAATAYYNLLMSHMHLTVINNRDKVWVILGNELAKERADWIGQWGLESAILWNAQGYKVALFGFASGTPEYHDWQTPGMLSFLRYAAAKPGQAAIAVHEYSYTLSSVMEGYPYLVGRFQFIYEACDEHDIAHPTVIVSEFGWTYNDFPEVPKAIADITEAADLYAQYPRVLGAATWYLGSGFNNIANKAQKLIAPLASFTLVTEFPGPEDPMPEPTLDEKLWAAGLALP